MRRDADKMLREYIAAQLEQQRKRLTEAQQELLGAPGGLDLMDDVDRVQKKLQLLIDRLRTAVYGYAGWFDAVTIREKELDALYTYDELLLQGVERVGANIQDIANAIAEEGELKPTLTALRTTLNGLHEHVDRRKDILTGAMPVPTPEPAPPITPPAADTTTGS
jgi:hypothetical protein